MAEKMKILLVEDEPVVAVTEALMLEKHGYSVITAQNGYETLEIVKQNQSIDLVLMDIDLGEGMDGVETAKRILEIKEMPIVFLSAHTEPEIVEKTKEITSYGYVVKTSGAAVLIVSVEIAFRLFEARREISEKSEQLVVANEELQSTFEELEASNEEFEAANEELLRLNEDLEKREQLLKFLNHLGKLLAAHIDVRGAVDAIMNMLFEFEGIDCAGVYVNDLDTGSFDLVVHRGLSKEFIERVSHYDPDSKNIQIAMQGPLYVQYSEIADKNDEARLKEGLRAIAILPVFHAGRLIAILNLASRTKDEISVEVRHFIESVALQVGSALHRVLVFERLQKSEKRLWGLINSMNEGFCYHELMYDEKGMPVDYRILEVNEKYAEMTGIPKNAAVGALASKLYGANEPPYLSIYADVALSGKGQFFETYFPPLDRHYRISVYSHEEGHFATIFQDVSKQKKEEKELQELAREREVLYYELRHRVKNSNALVNSIINMTLEKEKDAHTIEVLRRIASSINIITSFYSHQSLQENSHTISTRDFVRDISSNVRQLYNLQEKGIVISEKVEDVSLEQKQAVSLGLIINELILNSIKHAFPGKNGGTIEISLNKDDAFLKVQISDNGIGFLGNPENLVSEGRGLWLISRLADQLAGKVHFTQGTTGAISTIVFPFHT